jgi:hypothetical protein
MKTGHLFSAIAGLTLLLSATFQITQGQNFPDNMSYASDVKVTQQLNASNMTSKLAVTNNGWIFILARFDTFDGYKSWQLNCSKDEGKTFTGLCLKDYDPAQLILGQVDFVVTGNDSASIKLFIAEAITKGPSGNEDSYCSITTFDAAGTKTGTPYIYHWGSNPITNLSIACDFRAPDVWLANPFNVVLAWTGTDVSGNADKLNYAYSSDGGSTFTNYFLYNQPLPNHLGKVSISIGNASDFFSAVFGVAFELNKIGESGSIGIILNSLFLGGAWNNPVIVPVGNNFNPVISLKQKMPNVLPATNLFSTLVGYESKENNGDTYLHYWYLDYNFFLPGITQAVASDFTQFSLEPTTISRQLDINYDKDGDEYLLTWYSTGNNNLPYATIPSLNPSAVDVKGHYRDSHNAADWNVLPRLDINADKGKSCFSWVEHNTDGDNVYFDSEWSTVGLDELPVNSGKQVFTLYPNPAKGQCSLRYNGDLPAEASLIDMTGHTHRRINITGRSTLVNTQNLEPGVYTVSLCSSLGIFVQKLIVR